MFAAYSEVIRKYSGGAPFLLNLQDPLVLSGTLLGCLVPALFSALTMLAVTRNAFTMIGEIRRQFKAKPGILSGTETPDYAACIGIASYGALRALALPALIAVVLPLSVGFILGPGALGGFLGGLIFTGVVFALLMTNGEASGTMPRSTSRQAISGAPDPMRIRRQWSATPWAIPLRILRAPRSTPSSP